MGDAPADSTAEADDLRQCGTDEPRACRREAGTADRPRFCCSVGHGELPAVCLGVFDDGGEAEDDVAYCAECAQALIEVGELRVTEVLNPDRLGTRICPHCAGTGRLPFTSGQEAWAGPQPG